MTKLSISVDERDAATLTAFVATHPGATRSGAVRVAIGLLRERELADQYAGAFAEWEAGDDAELWTTTDTDGAP